MHTRIYDYAVYSFRYTGLFVFQILDMQGKKVWYFDSLGEKRTHKSMLKKYWRYN